MKVNVQKIFGNWDTGYSLDKHSLGSVFIGYNNYGHPMFDTTRTEIGEALYQLKFRSDRNQVDALGQQIVDSLGHFFQSASFILPMPASKLRAFQPVNEVANQVAALMNIPYIDNVLVKTASTDQVKNMPSKEDRVKALCKAFKINDVLVEGSYNALIVDDLYDTGSSLEAATAMLRQYTKIKKIFVATITRKNP
ncbi:ComF family protein [Methylomonas sp. AM2-LC]|uniref:ComF family protein n=1 Tax=Methylomonas sp. AM2-LC TaxID=3153301 RepID=UPI00326741F2